MAAGSPTIDRDALADCIARLRTSRPHVHCITNSVAQTFTANVLLACGATPSMTIAPAEVPDFVAAADALLINLGTLDAEREDAISLAVDAARANGKPWALDPVFAHVSSGRLHVAQALLRQEPTLLRGNAREAEALFGTADAGQLASAVSESGLAALVLTGETDLILDRAGGAIRCTNGSPLMDQVTAMGCALTAVMCAFCAIETNRLLACASALALFGVAGEQAARESAGPGTFVPSFLDALANLSARDVANLARLA